MVNKIHNENCLDTMARMKDGYIDLTVTSPPYDDLRKYNGYSFDFESIAKELYRVTKDGGVVVWVVGDATKKGSETGTSFRQALYFMQCGFRLLDTMIYKKPPRGACGNNRIYWQCFEYMFVFSKGSPKNINLIFDRKNKESRKGDNGTKRMKDGSLKKVSRGGYGEFGRRTNVWEYGIGNNQSTKDNVKSHPAIFPEKLASDHIVSWSKENQIVYDPFCGSGTTPKMAIKNNRQYIGSETSEEYTILSRQRINDAIENITQQRSAEIEEE